MVANYLGSAAKKKGRDSAVSAFVLAVKRANKTLEGHSLKGYKARSLEGKIDTLQHARKSIDLILAAWEEGEKSFTLAMKEVAKKVRRMKSA